MNWPQSKKKSKYDKSVVQQHNQIISDLLEYHISET